MQECFEPTYKHVVHGLGKHWLKTFAREIFSAVLLLALLCAEHVHLPGCRFEEEAPALIPGSSPPPEWPITVSDLILIYIHIYQGQLCT